MLSVLNSLKDIPNKITKSNIIKKPLFCKEGLGRFKNKQKGEPFDSPFKILI